MIYTITFNPSLDYVMHVDTFVLGETNRSNHEAIFAGGKGFNVSTILQELGLENTAIGFVAGFSGEEIIRSLANRGFHTNMIQLQDGMSRINVKMKGECETEINGAGPVIPKAKLEEFYVLLDTVQENDILILAGSIPASLPDNIYEEVMKRLQHRNIRIVVDATKQLLKNVLKYHPFLIKPNIKELEELFHTKINHYKDAIHYAKELQKEGAHHVLVSLGKEGALLVSEHDKIYYCAAAKGKLVNSVGSGDSMVAGFLAGILLYDDEIAALKLGSAAGGATAFHDDLANRQDILELYENMEIEELKI